MGMREKVVAGSILSVGAALVLARIFVFELFSVPSGSMAPVVGVGDTVLVAKWAAGRDAAIGDIVVFDHGQDKLMKRIVAGPGQTITIVDDAAEVDGHAFAVVSVEKDVAVYDYSRTTNEWHEVRGTLRHETIGSHTAAIFAPDVDTHTFPPRTTTLGANEFFVLGDSRDASLDSRTFGVVKRSAIYGRVHSVLWSKGHDGFSAVFASIAGR